MAHIPHRTLQTQPKPTVAEVSLPIQQAVGFERHLGTTRAPRPRVLKPPLA